MSRAEAKKNKQKKRLGSCAPGCPTCVKMHRGAGFIQALRFCLTSHELGYTCSGDQGQSEDDCPGERQSESNIQRLLRSVPSGDPVLKTDTPPYPGVIIMPGGLIHPSHFAACLQKSICTTVHIMIIICSVAVGYSAVTLLLISICVITIMYPLYKKVMNIKLPTRLLKQLMPKLLHQ